MKIKELSISEFSEYADNHPLHNYCQTLDYALLMSEYGYEYELIGFVHNDEIYAASLILTKNYNNVNFGYAPKGFLIDYSNKELLNAFTNELINYFYKKKFGFIKINPEVPIGEVNIKTFETNYNSNKDIITTLESLGYSKLYNNLYFESMFPRINPIINLSNFNISKLSKNTRNKIKKGYRKGLSFKKVNKEYIHYINEFTNKDTYYFNDLYNIYHNNSENIDLFIVKIDKEIYLEKSQETYNDELDNNQILNNIMVKKSSPKNINKKMNSDIALLSYKNDILEASKLIDDINDYVIGIALVVKNGKNVKILKTAFDKSFKRYVPNYFMYYNIIKYYENDFNFIDLNGISADYTNESPFRGLNRFKLGFNPKVYEYIGEFDLIIEPKAYKYLIKSGILAKEFKNKY